MKLLVIVWEAIAEAKYREKESLTCRFDQARDVFYGGDFAVARELFEAIKDMDGPAGYYVNQYRYYIENPSEWRGCWKAVSK